MTNKIYHASTKSKISQMVLGLFAGAIVDSSAFWMIVKGQIGYMPPIEDLQKSEKQICD